jgi:hypothetical protein
MRKAEPDAAAAYGKDYSILQTSGVEAEAQIGVFGTTGKRNQILGSSSKNSAHPR